MGVLLMLTVLIFTAWTIHFFRGENATRAAHDWQGTWLGDFGLYWIEVCKGTDSRKLKAWEQLIAVSASIVLYLGLFSVPSLVLAVIVKHLWLIILPVLIISKIIIKLKKKK